MALALDRELREGEVIDHLCRNSRCVRPEHLEVVDNAENSRRGLASGRPEGPRLGEIRSKLAEGVPVAEIAAAAEISIAAVYAVRSRIMEAGPALLAALETVAEELRIGHVLTEDALHERGTCTICDGLREADAAVAKAILDAIEGGQ